MIAPAAAQDVRRGARTNVPDVGHAVGRCFKHGWINEH